MKIGVSTRIVAAQGYSEDRDALAQVWGSFLATALPDALWLPIPNLGADRTVQYCADWGLDRLILSGGDDIGITPLRDVTEKVYSTGPKRMQYLFSVFAEVCR